MLGKVFSAVTAYATICRMVHASDFSHVYGITLTLWEKMEVVFRALVRDFFDYPSAVESRDKYCASKSCDQN